MLMRNVVNKIVSRGASELSDEELLALILADDMEGEQPLLLASKLLDEVSLSQLVDTDHSRLRMMAGMGRLRALRLKAAAELGRRTAIAEIGRVDIISSDKDVVRIMEPLLGLLQHEECWALYLASSGKVLDRARISQGGVQATVVDCKMVIRRALELLATQIVLVHNHPSGSAEPSAQDRQLTERVAEGCRLFDIRLLDHVIIARGAHYSFRAHGEV